MLRTEFRRMNPDLTALVAQVHQQLLRRAETVAVAESLTGGLLSAALSKPPGASQIFRGGLVVYATDLKAHLAGVDEGLLARVGAVHPDVAAQLATGAARRLGADWGIGVTGVAGPDRQDGQPVGLVFIGICPPAGIRADRVADVRRLLADGGRSDIRHQSVASCLRWLLEAIGDQPAR